MTDRAAFLRAIIAHPDDDLPRLIFADWLDEHGEAERAEFIRVQCTLAAGIDWSNVPKLQRHRDGAACGCKECVLRRRERELLRTERFDLWKCYCPWGRVTWTMTLHAHRPAFRIGRSEAEQNIWHHLSRGFVSEVACPWTDWQAHASAILEACPIANAADGLVRLTTWPDIRWHHHAIADRVEELAKLYPGVRFQLPRNPWDYRATEAEAGGHESVTYH